jgi:phage minor structural protein
MILYFADRRMTILGQASTNLPEGQIVTNDLKTEEIEVGVAILEFYIPFTFATRKDAESMAEVGNYILLKNEDQTEFYTIIDSECNTLKNEIYVYAEDAGLDLLNEVVVPYEADKAYPAAYYIEKFTYDSGFEIGINEISDLTRKLKWEGEDTVTARILSIATQFDNAEISYEFEIENMSIVHKYINIYKKRGKENDVELRLNRDVNSIIIKKSVANLATAVKVTGGTPEGAENPITLNGYAYDDGDFYLIGDTLASRNALAKWSRYLSEKGSDAGHIVRTYSYNTTSQSELCNRALSYLNSICDTEVNYEVDIDLLPKGTSIGDTVNIVDDDGSLYLSARLLRLETSVCNNTRKATLGDYLIKESGTSARLEELANQFKNIAKSRTLYTWIAYADDEKGTGISLNPSGKRYLGQAVNQLSESPDISNPDVYTWSLVKGTDAAVLRIDSSRGTVFKNNEITTVLTAVVYCGSDRITDIKKLHEIFSIGAYLEWSWQKLDESAFGVILATDKMVGNDGFTLTISSSEVDEKCVFKCELKN